MSSVHTIPLHIGDFITDTMHLTPAELGAYFRLLTAHYRMGLAGLPDDDAQLRRITGMGAKSWQQSRDTVLAFFSRGETHKYVHGRVQETLRSISERQAKNRDKALKRWNSTDATALPEHSGVDATAMQAISHKPKAIKEKRAKALSYSPEFEQFWELYPPNGSSKSEAFKSYTRAVARGAAHDKIIHAVRGYRRQIESRSDGRSYTAHATTWLNQSRWEVDYGPAETAFDRLHRQLVESASG